MITNRQKLILKAVIESYNKDGLPVGSSSIMDFPYLAKSSATIRADLALLEKNGFIQKTHSSSGRVPTNTGYKFYIENLLSTNKLNEHEISKIDKCFSNCTNFRRDIISNLITSLSNMISSWVLVFGPDLYNNYIYDCSLIKPHNKNAVIQMTVTSGASIVETIVLENLNTYDKLKVACEKFNELFKGRLVSEIMTILHSESFVKEIEKIIGENSIFLKLIRNLVDKLINNDVYSVGATQFISTQINDITNSSQFLEKLELPDYGLIKQLVINDNTLTVRIDDELPFLTGSNVVLISVPIKVSEAEKGIICVIGHKRLNYEVVVPLLEYTSLQISKLYK